MAGSYGLFPCEWSTRHRIVGINASSLPNPVDPARKIPSSPVLRPRLKPKNRSRKAGIGFVDFVSGGKRACGYRQTAENEAVGVKLPFRAHGKDFLQPREGRLSGAGRGVGVDRVDEDPLSLSVRTASRTDGILVPMRKNSHADEKKFSWA